MLFKDFSLYLNQLEQTSSRLEMTRQLASLFKELQIEEIDLACYLMQGKLVPRYQSLEFNLSVKMTIRALARLRPSLGRKKNKSSSQVGQDHLFERHNYQEAEEVVQKIYKQKGDLGLVAEDLLKDQKLTTKNLLSLTQAYQLLVNIAQDSGQGSQERKVLALVNLMENLTPVSAKFVVRIIIGKLRLGFSTMTILDALSWVVGEDKTQSPALEAAYQKKADIGKLAKGYLSARNQQSRQKFLAAFEVEVGIPVMPELCQRLNSSAEIIDKMTEVLAEPKYDGLRVQIHINKQGFALKTKAQHKEKDLFKYQTFTRNLDNTSHMFPELAEAIHKLNCESCILDSEAVGIDRKTGKILSFQETITRKRKHNVGQQASQVPVKFFVFDVLAINNKSLINEPLFKRKQVLAKLFDDNGVLVKTKFLKTNNPSELQKFHLEQLARGLEGAVIKKFDAVYRSGRKGWRWVKIKEEEGSKGKLKDTLDLVVMGYYAGRGKRASFGIGAFLVGVLDRTKQREEQIKTIAKIGTGLTDAQLKKLKQLCDDIKVKNKPLQYQVAKALEPDIWVAPQLVVEIAADEITRSPLHSAQVALRFPRLVKFRDDKSWEQATTVKELAKI